MTKKNYLLYTALFFIYLTSGCSNHPSLRNNKNASYPILELNQTSSDINTITGQWLIKGNWDNKQKNEPRVIINDTNVYHSFTTPFSDFFKNNYLTKNQQTSPLVFNFTNITISLFNNKKEKTFSIKINKDYSDLILSKIKDPNTDPIWTCFLLQDISYDYISNITDSFETKLSLSEVLNMHNYNITPEDIIDYKDAGYNFSPENIIKAKKYSIKPDFAKKFKTAGYDFDIDQLINIKRYSLNADLFTQFKEAGCNYDIENMIKARRYSIDPNQVKEFNQLNTNYNLDDFIKLHRYNISPSYIKPICQAGIKYSIDDFIKMKRYNIDSNDIVKLKNAEIDYGIDESIKLKRYNISSDTPIKIKEAGLNYSLDDLISFKRYSINSKYIIEINKNTNSQLSASEIINLKNSGIDIKTLNKFKNPE